MSWSRWGVDGSSVYTFPNVSGSYECCGCFRTRDLRTFLDHLDEHENAGDVVPPYTRPAIEEWAAEYPDGWDDDD